MTDYKQSAVCPNCGTEAEFTAHESSSTEPHGERFIDRWLICSNCGKRTDQSELTAVFRLDCGCLGTLASAVTSGGKIVCEYHLEHPVQLPRFVSTDPRGPVRQITAIEERTDATILTLSCGHIGRFNQIFHYKLGADCHCIQCREDFRDEAERKAYIAQLMGGLRSLI